MAKIMLVEDDNNLREIYGARLSAEGHTIVSARDGEEALALAVKEKPELIISDVMMPRVSGFDMLDILRNAPETKNTKIIMMTALSQAEDKARADKLGADMYLVKSQVTLEDVAKAVNKVLSDSGQAGDDNSSTQSDDGQQDDTQASAQDTSTPEPATEKTEETTKEPAQSASEAPVPEETPQDETGTVAPPVEATLETSSIQSPPSSPPQTETEPPTVQRQEITTPTPEPTLDTQAPVASSPPPTVTDPSVPKKIEVTEAVTSDNEAPEVAAPPQVVLPEVPASSENSQEKPRMAEVKPEVSSTNNEGPNLDDILAEESKKEEGTIQSPEVSTTPEEKPAESKPVEISVESKVDPLDNTPKKKVIEPLNDLTKKPDLDALLAKEEAAEAASNPPADTVVAPEKPTEATQQESSSDKKEDSGPPQSPPDDFSKVAL